MPDEGSGEDVFVRFSDISGSGFRALYDGETVEVAVLQDDRPHRRRSAKA